MRKSLFSEPRADFQVVHPRFPDIPMDVQNTGMRELGARTELGPGSASGCAHFPPGILEIPRGILEIPTGILEISRGILYLLTLE